MLRGTGTIPVSLPAPQLTVTAEFSQVIFERISKIFTASWHGSPFTGLHSTFTLCPVFPPLHRNSVASDRALAAMPRPSDHTLSRQHARDKRLSRISQIYFPSIALYNHDKNLKQSSVRLSPRPLLHHDHRKNREPRPGRPPHSRRKHDRRRPSSALAAPIPRWPERQRYGCPAAPSSALS